MGDHFAKWLQMGATAQIFRLLAKAWATEFEQDGFKMHDPFALSFVQMSVLGWDANNYSDLKLLLNKYLWYQFSKWQRSDECVSHVAHLTDARNEQIRQVDSLGGVREVRESWEKEARNDCACEIYKFKLNMRY